MFKRTTTKKIKVGSLTIGGQNSVIIQSMTNTLTKDIETTIKQINELEKLGCELVRVAVLDNEDAFAISAIKKQINIPLVADIHFNYTLALKSIEAGADKIRINPGNIGNEEQLKVVVDACKAKNIPIRIGINGGSLEKDLEVEYGHNSSIALYLSAKRNIQLIENLGYTNLMLSLKASDVITTIEAYKMIAKEYNYPLHIGITEAGTLLTSAIRSSFGLGVLLYEGLGDTLRISISGSPLDEIMVAKELLNSLKLLKTPYPTIVACPTCGRAVIDVEKIANEVNLLLHQSNKNITVAIMGCVVNGLGEGKNADIGIAGVSDNEVILFKKGKMIKKIEHNEIIDTIKKELEFF